MSIRIGINPITWTNDDVPELGGDTPLEVCEQRDVKGLYQKARRGEIRDFTGISSPYEIPEHAEIVVMTGKHSVEDCAAEIIEYLERSGKIGSA